MKKYKNNKGITLIALIITIVILLIMSGIVINTITGNESILENAKTAVDKYNNSVSAEKEILKYFDEDTEDPDDIDVTNPE